MEGEIPPPAADSGPVPEQPKIVIVPPTYVEIVKQDAKTPPGVAEKLAEIRRNPSILDSTTQAGSPEPHTPEPMEDELDRPEVNERLAQVRDQLSREAHPTPETTLNAQYRQLRESIAAAPDTLREDPFYTRKQERLQEDLAHSTPDEQEDILILHNKDWRAYLEKYGTSGYTIEDIAGMFNMRAADIFNGIGEGIIIDSTALHAYGEMRKREAQNQLNYDTAGADTDEQREVSNRALHVFRVTEEEIAPLLSGSPAEQARYCAQVAGREMTDEERPKSNAAYWYEMAARLAKQVQERRTQKSQDASATTPQEG